MLYERRFEIRTRGLVHGPALLHGVELHGTPHGSCVQTYCIIIRARESGEELWIRPFATRAEALVVWMRLIGIDTERPFLCPTTWQDGELEYLFVNVDQFLTVGGSIWNPTGGSVSKADVLMVAGGGGCSYGGGGAGGMQKFVNVDVVAGCGVVVGDGGSAYGVSGGNSAFGILTESVGGGSGGSSGSAWNGGSGGGGGYQIGARGIGVPGQGNDGSNGYTDNSTYSAGAGGGGKNGAGTGITGGTGGSSIAGHGGAGAQDSITGSSIYYAAGGAGWNNVGSHGSSGTGYRGVANSGCGATRNTLPGWSGIVVVRYTPIPFVAPPMPPMRRAYSRR